jgi:hypothetical protein
VSIWKSESVLLSSSPRSLTSNVISALPTLKYRSQIQWPIQLQDNISFIRISRSPMTFTYTTAENWVNHFVKTQEKRENLQKLRKPRLNQHYHILQVQVVAQ